MNNTQIDKSELKQHIVMVHESAIL